MIVYGIDETLKEHTDKTKMIVCSYEVKNEKGYKAFRTAVNELRKADVNNKVTCWITKGKYKELFLKQ